MEVYYAKLIEMTKIYSSQEEAIQSINSVLVNKPVNIAFLNAHAYNVSSREPRFLESIKNSDFVFRDGIGVKILYKMLKLEPGANLNGTDLVPHILKDCFFGKRIALIGSTDKELAIAKKKIENLGLNVVATMHGFKDESDYLSFIANIDVDVVLLGMGMPKQESLALAIRQNGLDVSVICGGAILDFLAEKIKRAPKWVRTIGCEWAYRLLLEPGRLFKRYILGNFKFLINALKIRGNYGKRNH